MFKLISFWVYPISLWIGYVLSRIHHAIKLQSGMPAQSIRRNSASKWFFALIVLFSTLETTTVLLSLLGPTDTRHDTIWQRKDYISSAIAVGLFYLAGLLPDPDEPYSVSGVNFHMWLISVIYEIISLSYTVRSEESQSWSGTVQVICSALRILVLFCLVGLFIATRPRKSTIWQADESETESLLGNNNSNSRSYLNGNHSTKTQSTARAGDAQTTTWLDYLLGFRKLFPFLWPSDSKSLQIRAVVCFCLLVAQRVINILAPHQLGVVVARLGPGKLPHMQILLYVLFRGLQGQQGVIGSVRAILWIPISQSTYRRLSSATFSHVLFLSLDFHLSKRIGEVMSALSKGGALNTFLDGLVFQLFPMVADLWIAAAYFFFVFDAYYSLMVISVTWFYIWMTIYMAKYRGRARREMVKREREMEAAKTDALLSYETVHHFGAVPMERSRYEKLISYFQGAEFNVLFSLNMLNVVQNGVFTLGTLLVCYLDAYQISINQQKVAMFVTLLTYIAQLQAPLNFFGSFYTQVQNNLVDAERMLQLYDEKPLVVDADDAEDLKQLSGRISFSNVTFSYNQRPPSLHNISFEILPGTSTAVVGESGSGKSTLLKLLFRFYDVDQGSIRVDGHDIRGLRMESLRSHIGVVPQDTILFNDTLMYNLLYARRDASHEEVYEACRAASIHDRIMSFPEGYMTTVGERGLKLSGGERQRIAIARAFLQSPRILLLDEATASLDSTTEEQIQGALEKVSEGRTTITIAHRLSTITKADQIIVLQSGRIVERGSHADLLSLNGVYATMWSKQTETLNDASLGA